MLMSENYKLICHISMSITGIFCTLLLIYAIISWADAFINDKRFKLPKLFKIFPLKYIYPPEIDNMLEIFCMTLLMLGFGLASSVIWPALLLVIMFFVIIHVLRFYKRNKKK